MNKKELINTILDLSEENTAYVSNIISKLLLGGTALLSWLKAPPPNDIPDGVLFSEWIGPESWVDTESGTWESFKDENNKHVKWIRTGDLKSPENNYNPLEYNAQDDPNNHVALEDIVREQQELSNIKNDIPLKKQGGILSINNIEIDYEEVDINDFFSE